MLEIRLGMLDLKTGGGLIVKLSNLPIYKEELRDCTVECMV